MKKIITLFFWILALNYLMGQDLIVKKPQYINIDLSESKQELLISSLDSLFKQMKGNKLSYQYVSSNNSSFTFSILDQIQSYETTKDSLRLTKKDKQIINFYPIGKNAYNIDLSLIDYSEEGYVVYCLLNLIANDESDKFTFEIPLDYKTRHWKTAKTGNITYYFRDTIQTNRGEIFDKKNTAIAHKFGLEPEKLEFFMVDNYQEYLDLMGVKYKVYENGKYRTGYGVSLNTIFSIMDNEDFSHDVFHYYSGKINKRENRNWISEEGIAYLWGNAYYTDKEGEMIEMDQMVSTLKKYLQDNHDADLFKMFEDKPKIFNSLASEISVRSVLSAIIAKEVEHKLGIKGILKLINAGGGKELVKKYLTTTDQLIGINSENFNNKVKTLIKKNRL